MTAPGENWVTVDTRDCVRRASSCDTASSSSGCAAPFATASKHCSTGATSGRRRGRAGSRSVVSVNCSVLVLAATQAVRRPGPLRAWFHAVKKRRGKNVARVALARSLAGIVYHIWKHDCDYFTVVRGGVVQG